MSGSLRVRFALLAALATAATVLAPSAWSATRPLPRLTSNLQLSGPGGSYARVDLPRALALGDLTRVHWQAASPDHLDAVVLIREGAGTAEPGLGLAQLHGGSGVSTAVNVIGNDGGRASGDPVYLTRVLPAGHYRLLLLSRGPNAVRLVLPFAPAGSTVVRASSAVRYVAEEVAGQGSAGVGVVPSVTASSRLTAGTRPLMLSLAWVKGTTVHSRSNACAVQNPDQTDEQLAGTPYCQELGTVSSTGLDLGTVELYQGWCQTGPGVWLYKQSVVAAGVEQYAGGWSLQTELGPGFPPV